MLSNGDASNPCVMAQGGSTPQQAPPTDPFATYLKGAFKSNANYLVKSAQEFPDDKYTVKLGTQPETRTFAALIGHVIYANYTSARRNRCLSFRRLVNSDDV
jgi:hypothetical protein